MNINKILLNELQNRLLEKIGSNPISGKHLVVVDIQPEYQKYIGNDKLYKFINFLNKNYESLKRLTFLYNGEELGMISEDEYINWLIELGLDENIVDNARFYDKGYAFFRYCMDSGIEHESTINLVRFMYNNHINDSRELTEEFWDKFINEYGNDDIKELLENSDDCINIPDLMSELRNYNNIIVCGGGINECLKEVEIALNALEKEFTVLTQFTY